MGSSHPRCLAAVSFRINGRPFLDMLALVFDILATPQDVLLFLVADDLIPVREDFLFFLVVLVVLTPYGLLPVRC